MDFEDFLRALASGGGVDTRTDEEKHNLRLETLLLLANGDDEIATILTALLASSETSEREARDYGVENPPPWFRPGDDTVVVEVSRTALAVLKNGFNCALTDALNGWGRALSQVRAAGTPVEAVVDFERHHEQIRMLAAGQRLLAEVEAGLAVVPDDASGLTE